MNKEDFWSALKDPARDCVSCKNHTLYDSSISEEEREGCMTKTADGGYCINIIGYYNGSMWTPYDKE